MLIRFAELINILFVLGSWPEVENQMIFALSAHPRKVGSRPEVENQIIFDSSVPFTQLGSYQTSL